MVRADRPTDGYNRPTEQTGRTECGEAYAQCSFANFQADQGNANACTDVSDWAINPATRAASPFVYLCGATGLGKTHLAAAAWHELVDQCPRPYWLNDREFYSAWYEGFGFGGRDPGYRPEWLVGIAKGVDVLVWDDLGIRERASDGWAATVHEIVEHRYANRLPTLFTSNHSPSGLPAALSDPHGRTTDRIVSGKILQVTGESWRTTRRGQR